MKFKNTLKTIGALVFMLACWVPVARAIPVVEVLRAIPMLSTDQIAQKVAGPLNRNPDAILTSSTISNAGWLEFPSTDVIDGSTAAAYLRPQLAQILTVTNFDSSAKMCISTPARPANTADCAATCAALSSTCAGTSGDASIFALAGVSKTRVFTGDVCICYLPSANNADAQLELWVQ